MKVVPVAIFALMMLWPIVSVAECPPIAILTGDDEACQAVARELHKLGVETTAYTGCSGLSANIQKVGDRFVLEVSDSDDSVYRRKVERIETVAVLIDTLIRTEVLSRPTKSGLDDPSGAVHSDAAKAIKRKDRVDGDLPEPPAAVSTDETGDAKREGGSPRSAVARGKIRIRIDFESAYGFERSLWLGGRLGACGKVGPVCLGLQGRFDFDVLQNAAPRADSLSRTLVDGALFTHFLIERGRLGFSPGIALGAGWLNTSMSSTGGNGEPVEKRGVTVGFQVDLYMTGGLTLSRHLTIEVNVAASFLLASVVEDASVDEIPLPREPDGWIFFGVGLRYELGFDDGRG